MLARPRLLELMRGRFEVGVVALVAGAGFGKTTLLRQAMADNVASPRGIDVSLTCGPADARATHLGAPALRRSGPRFRSRRFRTGTRCAVRRAGGERGDPDLHRARRRAPRAVRFAGWAAAARPAHARPGERALRGRVAWPVPGLARAACAPAGGRDRGARSAVHGRRAREHRGCQRGRLCAGRSRWLARPRQPGDDVRTERGAGVRARRGAGRARSGAAPRSRGAGRDLGRRSSAVRGRAGVGRRRRHRVGRPDRGPAAGAGRRDQCAAARAVVEPARRRAHRCGTARGQRTRRGVLPRGRRQRARVRPVGRGR